LISATFPCDEDATTSPSAVLAVYATVTISPGSTTPRVEEDLAPLAVDSVVGDESPAACAVVGVVGVVVIVTVADAMTEDDGLESDIRKTVAWCGVLDSNDHAATVLGTTHRENFKRVIQAWRAVSLTAIVQAADVRKRIFAAPRSTPQCLPAAPSTLPAPALGVAARVWETCPLLAG
jgi:hypothetical protein